MTRQEMFDKAYLGVIKQGGPAVQSSRGTVGLSCSYLSRDTGRKCAVGQLLTDLELIEVGGFVGGVGNLEADWPSLTILPKPEWLNYDNLSFLEEMQQVHDNQYHTDGDGYLGYFKGSMQDFAVRWELTVPELEQE